MKLRFVDAAAVIRLRETSDEPTDDDRDCVTPQEKGMAFLCGSCA